MDDVINKYPKKCEIRYYSKGLTHSENFEERQVENLLVDEDSKEIYAKSEHFEDGYVNYFIKINHRRRFVNPWGLTFTKKELSQASFLKVKENVFNAYIQFLITRKDNYLRAAERSRI